MGPTKERAVKFDFPQCRKVSHEVFWGCVGRGTTAPLLQTHTHRLSLSAWAIGSCTLDPPPPPRQRELGIGVWVGTWAGVVHQPKRSTG